MNVSSLQTSLSVRKFFLYTAVVFLTLGIFTAFGPVSTFAQSDSGITLQTNNRYPSPGESVTISIISRLVNLNDKEIFWSKNGEVFASGIGLENVTITAPRAGNNTVVTMQTATDNGLERIEITISANNVDLIWENTQSYTPPFYDGKALHAGWGDVRVTAIPEIYQSDGSLYQQDELVYTWKYNGLVYGNDSGRGQNSFVVGTVPRDGNRVGVDIETPDGDVVARESITFPIDDPELFLYEKDPLTGRQASNALEDDLELSEDTIDITAVPYFFLTESPNAGKLTYDWELNGDTISTPEERSTVRLRRESGQSGEARISLELTDTTSIFPELDERLTITF